MSEKEKKLIKSINDTNDLINKTCKEDMENPAIRDLILEKINSQNFMGKTNSWIEEEMKKLNKQ